MDTHNSLRKKLDLLGFTQPLPLGAVPLVGAILEDLIKTTESLRSSKDQVKGLLNEKKAWDLGVEAYKCDNSKLLAEVNHLNKEIIRQKDHYEAKKLEMIRKIRNLEMDKQYLEQHLQELGERYEKLECKYMDLSDPKGKSTKKPFISTVRSGEIVPPKPCPPAQDCCGPCPHTRHHRHKREIDIEVERLHKELSELRDHLEMRSKQIDCRDREIERLTLLLASEGRPVAALAEDCCYRNVKELTEDVNHLQKENATLKARLATQVVSRPTDREQPLMETCGQLISVNRTGGSTNGCNKMMQVETETAQLLCKELEERNREIARLEEELRKCCDEKQCHEKRLKLVEALSNKADLNDRYKGELQKNQKMLTQTCQNRNLNGAELMNIQKEVEEIRAQLGNFAKMSNTNEVVRKLQNELCAKDTEISQLRAKSYLQSSSIYCGGNMDGSGTLYDNILPRFQNAEQSRLERENQMLLDKMTELKCERDKLQYCLEIEQDKLRCERKNFNCVLDELKNKLERIEREKMDLLSEDAPKNSMLITMKMDLQFLRTEIERLRDENMDLRVKNDQLKLLTEQQCIVLEEERKKLLEKESQLRNTARCLNEKNSGRQNMNEELAKVCAELARCKDQYAALSNDNEKICGELLQKIEVLQKCENALERANRNKKDLEQEFHALKKRYSEQSAEISCHESKQREMAIETDTLRKQIETLRTSISKSANDNRDLNKQLSDAECDLATAKKSLKDEQLKVEEMKHKLQEYIIEVDRVEKLLNEKDIEREELLNNFRSLSHNQSCLEGSNMGLEVEMSQNRQDLLEAELKLRQLEIQLQAKEELIRSYEQELSSSIHELTQMKLELENCIENQRHMKSENETLKELKIQLSIEVEALCSDMKSLREFHEEIKRTNANLREEIKAYQCVDQPQNTDMLRRILECNREEMDKQRETINGLTMELNQKRRLLAELKKSFDDERLKRAESDALVQKYSHQIDNLSRKLGEGSSICSESPSSSAERNFTTSTSQSAVTKCNLYNHQDPTSSFVQPCAPNSNSISGSSGLITKKTMVELCRDKGMIPPPPPFPKDTPTFKTISYDSSSPCSGATSRSESPTSSQEQEIRAIAALDTALCRQEIMSSSSFPRAIDSLTPDETVSTTANVVNIPKSTSPNSSLRPPCALTSCSSKSPSSVRDIPVIYITPPSPTKSSTGMPPTASSQVRTQKVQSEETSSTGCNIKSQDLLQVPTTLGSTELSPILLSSGPRFSIASETDRKICNNAQTLIKCVDDAISQCPDSASNLMKSLLKDTKECIESKQHITLPAVASVMGTPNITTREYSPNMPSPLSSPASSIASAPSSTASGVVIAAKAASVSKIASSSIEKMSDRPINFDSHPPVSDLETASESGSCSSCPTRQTEPSKKIDSSNKSLSKPPAVDGLASTIQCESSAVQSSEFERNRNKLMEDVKSYNKKRLTLAEIEFMIKSSMNETRNKPDLTVARRKTPSPRERSPIRETPISTTLVKPEPPKVENTALVRRTATPTPNNKSQSQLTVIPPTPLLTSPRRPTIPKRNLKPSFDTNENRQLVKYSRSASPPTTTETRLPTRSRTPTSSNEDRNSPTPSDTEGTCSKSGFNFVIEELKKKFCNKTDFLFKKSKPELPPPVRKTPFVPAILNTSNRILETPTSTEDDPDRVNVRQTIAKFQGIVNNTSPGSRQSKARTPPKAPRKPIPSFPSKTSTETPKLFNRGQLPIVTVTSLDGTTERLVDFPRIRETPTRINKKDSTPGTTISSIDGAAAELVINIPQATLKPVTELTSTSTTTIFTKEGTRSTPQTEIAAKAVAAVSINQQNLTQPKLLAPPAPNKIGTERRPTPIPVSIGKSSATNPNITLEVEITTSTTDIQSNKVVSPVNVPASKPCSAIEAKSICDAIKTTNAVPTLGIGTDNTTCKAKASACASYQPKAAASAVESFCNSVLSRRTNNLLEEVDRCLANYRNNAALPSKYLNIDSVSQGKAGTLSWESMSPNSENDNLKSDLTAFLTGGRSIKKPVFQGTSFDEMSKPVSGICDKLLSGSSASSDIMVVDAKMAADRASALKAIEYATNNDFGANQNPSEVLSKCRSLARNRSGCRTEQNKAKAEALKSIGCRANLGNTNRMGFGQRRTPHKSPATSLRNSGNPCRDILSSDSPSDNSEYRDIMSRSNQYLSVPASGMHSAGSSSISDYISNVSSTLNTRNKGTTKPRGLERNSNFVHASLITPTQQECERIMNKKSNYMGNKSGHVRNRICPQSDGSQADDCRTLLTSARRRLESGSFSGKTKAPTSAHLSHYTAGSMNSPSNKYNSPGTSLEYGSSSMGRSRLRDLNSNSSSDQIEAAELIADPVYVSSDSRATTPSNMGYKDANDGRSSYEQSIRQLSEKVKDIFNMNRISKAQLDSDDDEMDCLNLLRNSSGRNYLLDKFVGNKSSDYFSRDAHYLDGHQPSIDPSSDTEGQDMKFFYSISHSKNGNEPEIIVNIMLNEDEPIESQSVSSHLSGSTAVSNQCPTFIIDSVTITYSDSDVSNLSLVSTPAATEKNTESGGSDFNMDFIQQALTNIISGKTDRSNSSVPDPTSKYVPISTY